MIIILILVGMGLAFGVPHFAGMELPLVARVLLGLVPVIIYFLIRRKRSSTVRLIALSEFLSNSKAVFGPKWGSAASGSAESLSIFVARGAEVLVAVDPNEPNVSNSVLLIGAPLELDDRATISRLAAEVELLRPPEFKKRFPGTTISRTPIYELTWK